MSSLKNVWIALLLSNQVANGKNVNQIPKDFSEWKKIEIELVNATQNETVWNTSTALYESLEKENSIAYTLIPWSKVYKDAEWKNILLTSPKWIVIRNKSINQKESTQDLLCVEYRGHQAWIKKSSLIENDSKSMEEIDKPTTEKVVKVNKSERKMEIYDQYWKNKVKEFRIWICSLDEWDKRVEGDWNTPEWKYYICFKNPASSFWTNPNTWWRLWSLQVSYPNSQDAFEWLISWDITEAQYNNINNSVKLKWIPSQSTRLWNYIMIHWGWSDYDWTIWCMALDDDDMLRLYNYISKWTDLYIE